MIADDFKTESESDAVQPPQPTGCRCGHVCGNGLRVVNINSSSRCFANPSKWFDTNVESAALLRSYSTCSSSTLVGGSNVDKYWVCARCRQATTDPKHSFGKINSITFYCCNTCWTQFRLQIILGMIFRMIQIHLCFTLFWIQSPSGVLLKAKGRNYTEWVLIIFFIVLTLVLQYVSFFNVLLFRSLSLLRRKQVKHPFLDFSLEAMCALGWVALIGFMAYDGVQVYGHGSWNGALIALITCAAILLLSYLFTTAVAWINLINTSVTVIQGFPDAFTQKPKVSVWRAIAYLS